MGWGANSGGGALNHKIKMQPPKTKFCTPEKVTKREDIGKNSGKLANLFTYFQNRCPIITWGCGTPPPLWIHPWVRYRFSALFSVVEPVELYDQEVLSNFMDKTSLTYSLRNPERKLYCSDPGHNLNFYLFKCTYNCLKLLFV